MKRLLIPCLLLTLLTASCMHPFSARKQESLLLASFTDNDVAVSIQLAKDPAGAAILSATFTPPEGYHLYSKDIPIDGLDGLGRPTFLELSATSRMTAVSGLTASAEPQMPNFEPKELLIYPAGEVTLSLQVELPQGTEWLDDSVRVTYMACSASLCKPPVLGKIVSIRIPGAGIFEKGIPQ